jgi:tetraacyldisaccharide 4'-kinase
MTKLQLVLTHWFENLWYRPVAPLWAKVLFKPLELLYCYLGTRKRLNASTIKYPVPIIIVGNITVGGTGKTPLLIYLVELLKSKGYKPAVVSRGYAAKEKITQPLLITSSTLPYQAGDEPVLIYQRTQVPVCVCPQRNLAVQTLLKHYPDCNVILSDDGLQHYSLSRDIEIVVIDAQRSLGNGHCLPLGALREKPERLNSVDFKIINGETAHPLIPSSFKMMVEGITLYALNSLQLTRSLIDFKHQTVNVVTGIGNPERFLSTLQQAGLKTILKKFPDHYTFQEHDLLIDNNFPIIMTEKDAVKCRDFKIKNVWYLPISARVESPFDELFLQRLQEVSTPCKSNY